MPALVKTIEQAGSKTPYALTNRNIFEVTNNKDLKQRYKGVPNAHRQASHYCITDC